MREFVVFVLPPSFCNFKPIKHDCRTNRLDEILAEDLIRSLLGT
jgi:hypothetical protein